MSRPLRRVRASLVALALLVLQGGCGSDAEPVVGVEAKPVQPAAPGSELRSIPCEPRLVLETVCQQCHTQPMTSGAPFPLRDIDDVQRERDGEPIYTRMIEQLDRRRMPLPPATSTDEQRDVLLAWLRDGAPGVSPRTCP